MHIKTLPVETDPTDVLLGLPRGKPRNPVNRKLSTRRYVPQLDPENLPRAASDSSLPDRLLGTRAAQTALSSTDLLGPRNLVVIRSLTRLHAPARSLASPSRTGDLARAYHTPKHCC